MKMELKNAIIGAILTFLVTAILQYSFLFFFGDDGKIELICNKLNDNSYQTIIALKNMSSDEYLKNIEIKLKDDIEIISLDIDGKSTENFSVINFEDVVPTVTSVITIISEEDITEEDLIIIKNGANVSVEEFNKATNYKIFYLIIIISYTITSFIIELWFNSKNYKNYKKTKDEITEEYNSIRKENEVTLSQISKIEKELESSKRKLSIEHTIYVKEMNQLEKENIFLKNMLLKKYDKKISKEQLETMLIKEMKRFSRKNIRHLTYDDVYNIIESKIKE